MKWAPEPGLSWQLSGAASLQHLQGVGLCLDAVDAIDRLQLLNKFRLRSLAQHGDEKQDE